MPIGHLESREIFQHCAGRTAVRGGDAESGDRPVEIADRSDLPSRGAAYDVDPIEDAPQFRLENVEGVAKRAKKYHEADIWLRDRFAEFAHRRQGIARRREPASYRAASRHTSSSL